MNDKALTTQEISLWPIIQAMIRCGLANNPTEAFKHQVRRYQQRLPRDSREFASITEMLNPKNEDGNFRIVHSSPDSLQSRIAELERENAEHLKYIEFVRSDRNFYVIQFGDLNVKYETLIGLLKERVEFIGLEDWKSYCIEHNIEISADGK